MARWAEWSEQKAHRTDRRLITRREVVQTFGSLGVGLGVFMAVGITQGTSLELIAGVFLSFAYFGYQRFRAHFAHMADEAGVLNDGEGVPVQIELLAEGAVYGTDVGLLTLEGGLLCFMGRQTSFALDERDVEPIKFGRYTFAGPKGAHEIRVTSLGRALDPIFRQWGPASPEAVPLLPPVIPQPGGFCDLPILLGGVVLGLLFLGASLPNLDTARFSDIGIAGLAILAAILFYFLVSRRAARRLLAASQSMPLQGGRMEAWSDGQDGQMDRSTDRITSR